MVEILDLIGVFAFAVFGAHKAIEARFDLFGVLACAAITAFGGGTIRELILNGTPVYLHDHRYLLIAMLGVFCAITAHKYFAKIEHQLLILDAVGIAVFAYIGAFRAESAQLGLAAMVLFAVLTAAGGGILSDIISGRRPEALYKDFYPLAAIVMGVSYFYVRPEQGSIAALTLIALAFVVRIISIRYKWKLWQPYKKPSKKTSGRLRKLIPIRTTSL